MSTRPSRTTSNGSAGPARRLRKLGLTVTPSVGNFILIHFPAEQGKTAGEADEFLMERGYVLRAVRGLWPAKLPAHDHRH